MDHGLIEQSGLVERYLLGQLLPEEREEFEDHYLDCPECLERLELTRRMRSGLAQVALEEAVKAGAARQIGILAALSRLARSHRAGLLVTALLVAALAPAGWMWRQSSHLGRDLEATRRDLEEARRATPQGAEELAAARQALAGERARREAEGEEHRRDRQSLVKELTEARGPQARTSIVPLSPERSGEGEPSTRITLSPSPGWIVLSLDLPPLDAGPYAAALLRDRRRLWQARGLEPDAAGSLAVSVPSSFLAPGDYLLELSAPPRAGSSAPVASFRFRVRQGR